MANIKKQTRTEKLSEYADVVFLANREAIEALPQSGPRGGQNARNIDGWSNTGNATITVACKKSYYMPTLDFYEGWNNRGTTAIPTIAFNLIAAAHKKLFVKKG